MLFAECITLRVMDRVKGNPKSSLHPTADTGAAAQADRDGKHMLFAECITLRVMDRVKGNPKSSLHPTADTAAAAQADRDGKHICSRSASR